VKIACVGGGPAGLYFAILTKLRDPAAEITVFERNPPGVTYGWGVVFWDDLADGLLRADPVSGRQILDAARSWTDMTVRAGPDRPVWLGGYGYSIGRARLLDVLTARAASLGVQMCFEHPVADDERFPEADLVVAADGAHSPTRARLAERLGTTVEAGRNRYLWLGTPHVFDTFTFSFQRTRSGWIWVHAYGFDEATSTCVVECPPETWTGLGLDAMDTAAALELLAGVFADDLAGQPLHHQPTARPGNPWLNFTWITNQRWFADRTVLLGDAAHTTHFSIGSGTKLAMEDAIGLDRALGRHADLTAALTAYQADRAAPIADRQAAARASAGWFERVGLNGAEPAGALDPVRLAYSLQTRRDPGVTPSGLDWIVHRASQNRVSQAARRRIGAARRRARWSHVADRTAPADTDTRLQPVDGRLAAEWDRLATRSGSPPFVRPGWISAWVDAFAPGREPQALTARRTGELVGVLPLLNGRGGLRSPTNGESMIFTPVVADTDAAVALADRLAAAGRVVDLWPLAVGEGSPGEALQAAAERRGATVLRRTLSRSPILDLTGTWAEHIGGWSARRRYSMRKLDKRLNEAGAVSFEIHDGRQDLDALLADGFRLEGRAWKLATGSAILSHPSTTRFYTAVARWAAEADMLRLAFLRLDGRPIAFSFNLQDGGRFYGVKLGMDDDYGKLGPGTVLTRRLVEHAFDQPDLTQLDLLGQNDEHKADISSGTREQVRLQLFPAGWRGQLHRAAVVRAADLRSTLVERMSPELRERLSAARNQLTR
jgi:anthraniloyl-CoA monooxygenase